MVVALAAVAEVFPVAALVVVVQEAGRFYIFINLGFIV
jgi:hypothetical protein